MHLKDFTKPLKHKKKKKKQQQQQLQMSYFYPLLFVDYRVSAGGGAVLSDGTLECVLFL